MKISTKGRYALRFMLDLAEHATDRYITLNDVSSRQEISEKYLEQIVSPLSRAGFVQSARGPHGGYKLAREPREYNVGEILRTIEGSLSPVACLEQNSEKCRRKENCPVLGFWQGLDNAIETYVDSYTLEDLL